MTFFYHPTIYVPYPAVYDEDNCTCGFLRQCNDDCNDIHECILQHAVSDNVNHIYILLEHGTGETERYFVACLMSACNEANKVITLLRHNYVSKIPFQHLFIDSEFTYTLDKEVADKLKATKISCSKTVDLGKKQTWD